MYSFASTGQDYQSVDCDGHHHHTPFLFFLSIVTRFLVREREIVRSLICVYDTVTFGYLVLIIIILILISKQTFSNHFSVCSIADIYCKIRTHGCWLSMSENKQASKEQANASGANKQKFSALNINNLYKGKSLENPKTSGTYYVVVYCYY